MLLKMMQVKNNTLYASLCKIINDYTLSWRLTESTCKHTLISAQARAYKHVILNWKRKKNIATLPNVFVLTSKCRTGIYFGELQNFQVYYMNLCPSLLQVI